MKQVSKNDIKEINELKRIIEEYQCDRQTYIDQIQNLQKHQVKMVCVQGTDIEIWKEECSKDENEVMSPSNKQSQYMKNS